jgi:hypothetical protein
VPLDQLQPDGRRITAFARECQPAEYEHNGLRADVAGIPDRLIDLARRRA